MGRWLGGVFGNTKLASDPQTAVTGRYTISDQYYMRQEGGWTLPYGSQLNPITTGPAAAWATGQLSDGQSYYWTNVGNATANNPKQYTFSRLDNKSWVKITHGDFSGNNSGNNHPNFDYTYASDGTPNIPGWGQHNGLWFFRSNPGNYDTEMWNDFDLGLSFRYFKAIMYWTCWDGSTLGQGHPDNDLYDNYMQNDNDYNSRNYSATGGNRSWHRFGLAGVMQQAYSELGWTGEVANTTQGPIYVGNKTSNYAAGTSRIGSGTTGYWDTGSTATRTFRFSTGHESGAAGSERYAWCPYEIMLSDG